MKNFKEPDLQLLKSGDIGAYESLFRHYYPLLVAFASKHVNDKETARELVQDFFVRLFEKRQFVTIETSVRSYLYRSVHNSCINFLTQRALHDKHIKKIELEKDTAEDPEDTIRSIELQQKIHDIVEQLPSKCRKIFRMNRYEGLKNEEIAENLKLSKRTVETQISKALKILRTKLSGYGLVALTFLLIVLI